MSHGMYRNAEQVQLTLILDLGDFEIIGARIAGASNTKSTQLSNVSIETVTKVHPSKRQT